MRLRTYESFWLIKNGLLYSYPSLQKQDISTQLVVVGGGITGALISHSLCEKGYDVVLLDKRDIGQGSTSATTSMLQYEIDTPLYELADMIGEEAAVICYQAGVESIGLLEELVKKHKISCGFERKKSLYLAHNKKASEWLKDEFEIRKKHGFDVKWLTPSEAKKKYGVTCHGAILSGVAASVDAYRLAHELIAMNVKKGKLTVYDQSPIDEFVHTDKGVQIKMEEGPTVSCEKVIFCTGFESTEMIKEDIVKLLDSYACVSEQGIKMPKILNDTLVWDTDNPYLYMRTTDDGRLLVGGEDSSFNFSIIRQKMKGYKMKKLKQKLEKLMEGVDFVEDFSWGGTFGETKDGLPYIGISDEFKNGIFVLGFGGNGITFSAQGMYLVHHMLDGTLHPLLNYYRFGR